MTNPSLFRPWDTKCTNPGNIGTNRPSIKPWKKKSGGGHQLGGRKLAPESGGQHGSNNCGWTKVVPQILGPVFGPLFGVPQAHTFTEPAVKAFDLKENKSCN